MADLTPPHDANTPAETPLSIGGEVADALLQRISATYRLCVDDWATEAAESGELVRAPDIILTLRGSARELAVALTLGASAYIELCDDDGIVPGLPARLSDGTMLHLSLSTATSFSLDPAPVICAALAKRGWLGPNRRADAEMCLHEAISNAVIHGNLGIRNGPSGAPGAFDAFFREVHGRLADRAHAVRRVLVEARTAADGLRISITDEGDGHPALTIGVPGDAEAKSGRGIGIMRELADEVTFASGGRRTILYFRP